MRLWSEEQFGPVIPIAPYNHRNQIVQYHRLSQYGQQASIFGSDPKEIAALVDALSNQVSRININCECQRGPDILPFTGRKDSATGTLSVSDAPKIMSIRRVTSSKENPANMDILRRITEDRLSVALSTDWVF
jgi:glyceraldehyde-3-phosphate dehydrogenase (NADP+)